MRLTRLALVCLAVCGTPALAHAQFGLGGRMSMIRTDVGTGTDAQRFFGGHVRARMSPRTAVELALDRRTETNETLTERIVQTPVQASLLLFPFGSTIAPYVLGGPGWYTTKLETLVDREATGSESTRRFGWHAGFGAELRLGRHTAAHADYRYTFLKFKDDGDEEESLALRRLLPGHEGSMWTAGLTLYF